LTDIRGTWVTEDCEPVRVEFAWQNKKGAEVLSEADCLCSHELAARLVHLLWAGSDEQELQAKAPLATSNLLTMAAAIRGN
jgi:hypothetical protein